MNAMLEKAVAEASRLPSEQQEAIAALIFEEIEDEKRWDATFASTPHVLEGLAAEAEAEHRRGLTLDLDPES